MKTWGLFLVTILLSQNLFAQAIVDEVIVSSEEGRNWEAHLVASDVLWQMPACVAETKADDGLSSLEVVAFYDAAKEAFGEPMIHVITPFDVSFFEVTIRTEGSSAKTFDMLPVALPNSILDGQEMVAARALFDDRSDIVSDLRRRNRVTAKYFDLQGEAKSLEFSLRGSSKTLRAMFEKCELEFSDLPLLPEALPELL